MYLALHFPFPFLISSLHFPDYLRKIYLLCQTIISDANHEFSNFAETSDFGISGKHDRDYLVSNINDNSCAIKLFGKSHLEGGHKKITQTQRIKGGPPNSIRSLATAGNCCWRIVRYLLLFS